MFLFVSIISLGLQIFLIEVGGDFVRTSPLTLIQWLITIALGFIGVPIGILMRLIPIKEDPNSFFTVDTVIDHEYNNKEDVINCLDISEDIVIDSDTSTLSSSRKNSKKDVDDDNNDNNVNEDNGKLKFNKKDKNDYDRLLLETKRNNAIKYEEKSNSESV